MCILLLVISPSLSIISCIGDVVEEMQTKLTAHFTTRHVVAIDWELVRR